MSSTIKDTLSKPPWPPSISSAACVSHRSYNLCQTTLGHLQWYQASMFRPLSHMIIGRAVTSSVRTVLSVTTLDFCEKTKHTEFLSCHFSDCLQRQSFLLIIAIG